MRAVKATFKSFSKSASCHSIQNKNRLKVCVVQLISHDPQVTVAKVVRCLNCVLQRPNSQNHDFHSKMMLLEHIFQISVGYSRVEIAPCTHDLCRLFV